ncbi:MAG TPA: AAA family ATPase, partial [Acidimicrobiales bacterium]|nr:AAA family ATPase [Acidimicrobiales bacterium]
MSATGEERLLGRRDELRELRAALDRARDGGGGLVLVMGDAGIGKSSFLEAFTHDARRSGVPTVWGRCWEARRLTPFWPWRQVLGACTTAQTEARLRRAERPSVATPLGSALLERLGGVVGESFESRGGRMRLFDGVADFLVDVAGDGLVVALEDLQVADESSLRLLEHATERLSASTVLLVGTSRRAAHGPRTRRLLDAVGARGNVIVLRGLQEGDVHSLLEDAIGENVSTSLAQRVSRATGGNPFLVRECARSMRGQTADTTVALPERGHYAAGPHLDGVSERVRPVLALAAVIGRAFALKVVEAASDLPPNAVLDALGEAAPAEVVHEEELGRWSFVHDLLREAIYDQIPPASRPAMHLRVAEALERLPAEDLDLRVAELADHFFEAARGGSGSADKARQYCVLAGDAATRALAFEEAAGQYGRALQVLELSAGLDEHVRCELLLRLGQAKLRLRELLEAREIHWRALKSARSVGSAELFGRAALGLFGEPESTVDAARTEVLDEARRRLPKDDSALRARVLTALAAATTDRHAARGLSDMGVAMARRLGDRDTLWATLWQWHHVNHEPELLDERLRVAAELVELAADAGDKERLQLSRQWRAYDFFTVGEVAAASAELHDARRAAEELRVPFLAWGATFQLGAVALLQGRLDEAERLAHEAVTAGERTELADVEGVISHQLFALRREQGRVEDMELIARRRLEASPHWAAALRRAHLALALAEGGKSDEARKEVATAAPELMDYWGWGRVSGPAVVADVSWILGDNQWAQRA